MNETIQQILAWVILALFSPTVLLAIFDYRSGKGFWRDYLTAAIGIASIAVFFGAVLAITWAVMVVFR